MERGHPTAMRGMRLPKIHFLQPMLFSFYLGSQKRKNEQNEQKEIKHHHEKEKKKKARYTIRKTQKGDWRQRQEFKHLLMSETKVG